MIKVGDRVVCVKAHRDPRCNLVVGREYIIYASRECSCGAVTFDIGITTASMAITCKCGRMKSPDGVWWICQTLFRKVEEPILN